MLKKGNVRERWKAEGSNRIHLSLKNGNISSEISFVLLLPSAGDVCTPEGFQPLTKCFCHSAGWNCKS